jgi:nicotinate-nucleotide adenylyltransferase
MGPARSGPEPCRGAERDAAAPGPRFLPSLPASLGVFGGTFDPIHYGHLRAADEVAEGLGLAQLWFMPASVPPHKARPGLTSFEKRLAMAELAVAGHPRLSVSDLEGRRPGKSFTVETLRLLRRDLGPRGGELFYILGLDAILEIATWKDYRELFTLSHFVVLDRPGYDPARLAAVLRQEVHPDFREAPDGTGFVHPSGCRVLLWATTRLDISATRIRALAAAGRSLRYLLPEAVRRFILENKLYV